MSATVIVAITAVAASTRAVDAIAVESLVEDWGFEVGAEKVYFRLSPPLEQWMQKRLRLWLKIGSSGSSLGALWELVAVAHMYDMDVGCSLKGSTASTIAGEFSHLHHL